MKQDGERNVPIRYELRARRVCGGAPGRALCWDLTVSDAYGRAVLEDIARSRTHAEKIRTVFEENGVDSITAACVMEDLLADASMLE